MTLQATSKAGARLRTKAWLLRGISSIPGELLLADGAVSFLASGAGSAWPWQLRKLARVLDTGDIGAAIAAGEPACLFRWAVREVQAWCPWYYFGGGLKLGRRGVVLRLSFGAPEGAQVDAPQGAGAVEAIGDMRRVGALWRDALAAIARRERDPTP